MTKELGEAIEYFKRISKEWKKLGNTQIEAAKKLELILQVLKNSIPKEVIEKKIEEVRISSIEVSNLDLLYEILEENKNG